MSDQGGMRKVGVLEALELRERAWCKRLDAVSLAAEYPVNTEHARQMLEVLGRQFRKYERDSGARARALRRFPAVQILATTSAAMEMYDAKGFWPKFAAALKVPASQHFQQEWGQAFLDNLEELGLPTFQAADADAGTRYLGRILMHCGMPTKCLDDYYRLITEQRSKNPGLDAESFVSWAAGRAEASRLHNVDMPVNRFIRFGGVFAVDVTDRVFELLDVVSAGGDGGEVPLPDRFRLKALEMNRVGALDRPQVRLARGERVYPHLVLDPYGGGPLLRLPPVGDAPDGQATWIVTLDGNPRRVGTASLWPGSAEPAPATTIPIPRPIRVASAALEGREHLIANVPVVDDSDPLLAFAEDGIGIQPGIALPGGPVWLLAPVPSSQLEFDGLPITKAEASLPPGWSAWSLTLVDLTDTRSVRVGGHGRQHEVRRLGTARIDTGQPLTGVRTASGDPLFTTLPVVSLPAGKSSEAQWDVTLLDHKEVALSRMALGEEWSSETLWADVARPVLGKFTVRVRGPWGRGATRTLAIAEGLNCQTSPAWRRLAPDGLAPETVTVTTPPGMYITSGTVPLGPMERECHVTVKNSFASMTVKLTPPHMTVAHQTAETTTKPSIRPLTLFCEDVIRDAGTLILDVGAEAQPTLTAFSGRQPVQLLAPAAGRQGIYRFDLSRLVDTLSAHRRLTLALGTEGQLPVASIRPQRLFSSVTPTATGLSFADCADVPGLVALVYAAHAPWRPPSVIPIESGAVELPDELVAAGPLHVSVRVEDPWASEPVPGWPEPGTSHTLDLPGWLQTEDPEETAVSAFLAGIRELPEDIAAFPRLWTARATLSELRLGNRAIPVRDAIEAAMFRQPKEALIALAESSVPTAGIPSLVVRCGLAWANLMEAHDDEAPRWTQRGALPCALLSAADAEWSQEEVDAAIEVCGSSVTSILEGKDPFATAGRFDGGADLFADNPSQREAIMAQMGLVPQGLLGGDSRVLASMEIIARRKDTRLARPFTNARTVCRATEAVLLDIASPEVIAAFRARKHPTRDDGWRATPAISLGLAITARYAARGNEVALRHVRMQQPGWVDLANALPQLVTIDLVLAELLVAGSETRRTQTA